MCMFMSPFVCKSVSGRGNATTLLCKILSGIYRLNAFGCIDLLQACFIVGLDARATIYRTSESARFGFVRFISSSWLWSSLHLPSCGAVGHV